MSRLPRSIHAQLGLFGAYPSRTVVWWRASHLVRPREPDLAGGASTPRDGAGRRLPEMEPGVDSGDAFETASMEREPRDEKPC